jgi:hypothetical protein
MTEAYTTWKIKTTDNRIISILEAWISEQIIEEIYSTFDDKKTHWFIYVILLKPSAIAGFIRIRRSNRGNTSSQFFNLKDMERFRASKEEVELLKDLTMLEEELEEGGNNE